MTTDHTKPQSLGEQLWRGDPQGPTLHVFAPSLSVDFRVGQHDAVNSSPTACFVSWEVKHIHIHRAKYHAAFLGAHTALVHHSFYVGNNIIICISEIMRASGWYPVQSFAGSKDDAWEIPRVGSPWELPILLWIIAIDLFKMEKEYPGDCIINYIISQDPRRCANRGKYGARWRLLSFW